MTPSADEQLKESVEREVLACIGCNDCLLACPVVESRHVTIAELNGAVHLPTITEANVARFVTACTQCRQCVPACPADLNRADMVLLNKLKVEDSVPDHELTLQARSTAFASGMTLDGLSQKLTELVLFQGASPVSLRRLVLKSTLRLLVPGEQLCQEGEFHERLCVVLSGTLEQQSAGPNGVAIQVLKLAQGSFFGEMGVLSDSAEPFTVLAQELSIVLEAPKIAVIRLMEQAPSVRASLDALYEKRALWSYSRNPGGLGVLPEAAVAELLWSARLELLPTGTLLFSEQEAPRDLFLVRSGFLRASQHEAAAPGTVPRERVLTYFREGNVFGILPLLEREPTMGYSVHAASRSEVIRVPGQALAALLTRYPQAHAALHQAGFEAEALARNHAVGLRPAQGAPELSGARRSLAPEMLVEEGLAKGREILVIDQERCTACSNCIDACERRHGNSRLQLRGIQADNYMFPTACRHCEDPACLLCSVDGIVRLPSGEIKIVDENCIGCGSCAQRCPYGNISMHAVEKPERGLLVSLLDFLATGSLRERALQAVDPKAARVAVKCDLCAEYSDYACVTACPVGAAFRIDPGKALLSAAPRSSMLGPRS
ncbi:MAG: cyclic nucleotide-binding protein [Polyangiaceae bacterium]|jgi:Fe-S-cluster-containing hydrogenase component 2/CRP-like cAMP-binding protein|nr:cyclic nucleotide-binding protein [Polyangiaceae bacterium]